MASNINYASIDESYPIAGKDNDSQGFRDNFGYIKNSFETAKSEIDNLQANTAKTNTDNSFNFQTLSQAQLKNWGETLHDGGTISLDGTRVYYTDGSIQIFEIDDNLSLILDGFPESNIAAKLRIQLTSTSAYSVTFELQGGSFKKISGVNTTIALTNAGTYIFDFWTYDNGSNVFMDYVGRFV